MPTKRAYSVPDLAVTMGPCLHRINRHMLGASFLGGGSHPALTRTSVVLTDVKPRGLTIKSLRGIGLWYFFDPIEGVGLHGSVSQLLGSLDGVMIRQLQASSDNTTQRMPKF